MIFLIDHHAECLVAIDDDGAAFTSRSLLATDEDTPSEGQAEFIIAKHRNGGLENIRLKFIGHLGKFDNLDDFDSPFDTEFHSKMNAAANDDTFKQEDFRVDPSQAFGDTDDDTPY